MKAFLLASGLGTRLRPITEETPKCLVPINGKPLLEYWLENIFSSGVKECLIRFITLLNCESVTYRSLSSFYI